jgi:hypothetical protein
MGAAITGRHHLFKGSKQVELMAQMLYNNFIMKAFLKFLVIVAIIIAVILAAGNFIAKISLEQATAAFLKYISTDYPAGRYRATTAVIEGSVAVKPYSKNISAKEAEMLLGAGQATSIAGVINSVFKGVEVINASYKKVDYIPKDTIRWEGVSFDLKITDRRIVRTNRASSVYISQMSFAPEDIKKRTFMLTMTGIKGYSQDPAYVAAGGGMIEVPECKIRLRLASLNPKDLLEEVRSSLEILANALERNKKRF